MTTDCTLYLRLSDFRDDSDGFDGREKRLRDEAKRLGWTVGRVVVENDEMAPNGNGRSRPASAFKRRKVTTPSGRVEWRVYRPGFRSILDDLMDGRVEALLCEDLDRAMRDPRDLEDLIDAVKATRTSARSVSGSLTLTNGGTDNEITSARIMVAVANKSSRDTARRVADKRGDLAGQGWYGGGRRPFGFQLDPASVKYQRTLVIDPEEAAELRTAAAAVLAEGDDKMSLKAVARSLRERGVPSVTGATWTPETVKDTLIKPATAGLAVTRVTAEDGTVTRTLVPAKWPAILERETWEAVVAKLTDPARKTTTTNAPRRLLSGIARCHCGATVKGGGGRQGTSYVCSEHNHLRRQAPATDAYVLSVVAAVLDLPANRDLLRPPPRAGVDAPGLRAEASRLEAIGKRSARMYALGDVTDAEYLEGARARKARLAAIAATLAQTTAPDPLAEFRDAPGPAAAVLAALPLERRRQVVRLLARVTLLPTTRGGRVFDPDTVRVQPDA